MPRAALASPGPMAAATSKPVAAPSSSSFLPSGRTTCIVLSSLSLPQRVAACRQLLHAGRAACVRFCRIRCTLVILPCMHLVATLTSDAQLQRNLWRFRDPLGRFHLHPIRENSAAQMLKALAAVEFAGALVVDPEQQL